MVDKKYLTLKVGETEMELLSLGELPALRVMEMLKAKDDKLEKALELMSLASRDPKAFAIERDYMSFNELIIIIDEWMDMSSADSSYLKRQREKAKTKKPKTPKAPKDEVSTVTAIIDSVMDVLLPDVMEGLYEEGLEPSDENVSEMIAKSGLVIDGLELKESIKLMAMWCVANDRQDMLINTGLLIGPDRAGKFYPIVGGVTKRSLGFTKAEAQERLNVGE